MSWLIPGVAAVAIAGATSFITSGPIPTGPVKACTSVVVMGSGQVIVSDCEGNR